MSIKQFIKVNVQGVDVNIPIIDDNEIKKLDLNARITPDPDKAKKYGLDNPEGYQDNPKFGKPKKANSISSLALPPQQSHGTMGWSYQNTSTTPINGLYAIQSVDSINLNGIQIPANPPYKYSTDLVLYTPTLYPPHSCIEGVTWYNKSITNGWQTRRWAAWNWCQDNPNFAVYKDLIQVFSVTMYLETHRTAREDTLTSLRS